MKINSAGGIVRSGGLSGRYIDIPHLDLPLNLQIFSISRMYYYLIFMATQVGYILPCIPLSICNLASLTCDCTHKSQLAPR